jgi:hypothetical protein
MPLNDTTGKLVRFEQEHQQPALPNELRQSGLHYRWDKTGICRRPDRMFLV